MRHFTSPSFTSLIAGLLLLGLFACATEVSKPARRNDWTKGEAIASGMAGVPDIKVLTVHSNGSGYMCGTGRTATLKYKAMLANGEVLDPGTLPFTFRVGAGKAIKGWDVIVPRCV